MLTKEELELLEYTDDIRELYMNEGSITLKDGMFYINNQEVLKEIIIAFLSVDYTHIGKLYQYLEDEVDCLYYEFIYRTLNGEISLSLLKELRKADVQNKYTEETDLYYAIMAETECPSNITLFNSDSLKIYKEKMLKYINNGQYVIALEFVKEMHKRIKHYVVDILMRLLSSKEDKVVYILEKGTYPSEVTNENLHRIERENLVILETGDVTEFLDEMEVIEYLYENQDPLPLLNINTLASAQLLYEADETYVSGRSLEVVTGDFSSVLFELLRCNDFYRVDELIKQEKASSSEFSIYLEILDIISSRIMRYNRENMEYVKRIVSSLNTGENDLEKIVSEYSLSSISGEIIREQENNEYISKSDTKNYYRLYQVCFENREYKEALKALMKLDKKGRAVGYYINVDYLVSELKIYIANQLDNEKLASEADKERAEADRFFEEGNYIKAILKYDKAQSLIRYKVPRLTARIGECYYRLRDYEKAWNIYNRISLNGLYPDDLLIMLECLFKVGQYNKMPRVFARLEEVSPKCNVRIYYMMSIVYVKLHKYNEARSMLDIAEELNYDYNNVTLKFDEERAIIDNAERLKSDECYSMDDFIDLAMSEEEIDLSEILDDYRYEYDAAYIDTILMEVKESKRTPREKILYLLSIVKILKIQNDDTNVKSVYDYLNTLLDDPLISKSDQKEFTLTMKNYKKL